MKQSTFAIKNEFRGAFLIMLELFLPFFAICSLFMCQLLAVGAFISFGIGCIWSVMGHGNDLAWWALKTLPFAAVSGCSYLGCMLLLSKLKNNQNLS